MGQDAKTWNDCGGAVVAGRPKGLVGVKRGTNDSPKWPRFSAEQIARFGSHRFLGSDSPSFHGFFFFDFFVSCLSISDFLVHLKLWSSL